MRLAVETDTPIVPIAVVGSEEQAIAIANARPLAHLLGMPAFPVTITFPWLGLLGLLPFPVKYHIYFGQPMRFTGDPGDAREVTAVAGEPATARIATRLADRPAARQWNACGAASRPGSARPFPDPKP